MTAYPPTFAALHAAWRNATQRKRRRPDVCAFEAPLAENLLQLEAELAEGR